MRHEKILRMTHIGVECAAQPAVRFEICGTTYPNSEYRINRPASSCSCIEYVVSGSGTIQVDGKSFSVNAGDTYFLPQGKDHLYFADRAQPFEKIWINFSGDYAGELIRLNQLESTYLFCGLDTSDLLQKFQPLAQHREIDFAAEQCTALLLQLLFRMSRHVHSALAEPKEPIRKMLLYIEQHASEPITLAQIAAVCGRSPSQAERIFRSETGRSLYSYALDRRLSVACQLLTETGMPIKEIAAYLSFGDEFYFSGLFHRKIGVSPSRYRESGGKPAPTDQ